MARKKKDTNLQGVHGYAKTTLVSGERILYAAKLHFFSYVFPGILALFGAFLLFGSAIMPDDAKVAEDIVENKDGFMVAIQHIQMYIVSRLNDIKSLVPEAMRPFVDMLTSARSYFMGMLFFGFGIGGLANAFIKKKTLEFVVTTRKVIFKKGFITRDATELSLDRIESVKVYQTAFDRVIGKGRLFVMGIGMEQINLKNVANPTKFHHEVVEAMNKYVSKS